MLTCEGCGSREVLMTGLPREGAAVCCGDCGLFLGTYPTFFSRFATAPMAERGKDAMPSRLDDGADPAERAALSG